LVLVLVLFLVGVVVGGRAGEFVLKSFQFLLLLVEDALEFEYLVLEFPQGEFGVVAAGLDLSDFLPELAAHLHRPHLTSASSLHSFTNSASFISIFSRSIRYSFEFRTTSSDITISWCSFGLWHLNTFYCMYFRPKDFMPRVSPREKPSSRGCWGWQLSGLVFSEIECFRSSTAPLLADFSPSFITKFIISSPKIHHPPTPLRACKSIPKTLLREINRQEFHKEVGFKEVEEVAVGCYLLMSRVSGREIVRKRLDRNAKYSVFILLLNMQPKKKANKSHPKKQTETPSKVQLTLADHLLARIPKTTSPLDPSLINAAILESLLSKDSQQLSGILSANVHLL
jgi:hypothetical protein